MAALTLVRAGIVLLVSLVFAVAAIGKILDPAAFQQDILAYDLLGHAPSALLALWLPWWELLWALACAHPALRRSALIHLGLLLVVFSVLLLITAVRGIDIDCGCLGQIFASSVQAALLRNLILLALLLLLAWTSKNAASSAQQ